MIRTLKQIVNRSLNSLGYKIVKQDKENFNFAQLSKLSGATVIIDVGAGVGMPELYDAFEDSFFILIEPQEECYSKLKEATKNLNHTIYQKLASDTKGTKTLNVNQANWELSSLLTRTKVFDLNKIVEAREIECDSIDNMVRETCGFSNSFFLKIDVEGYEKNVLEGCQMTLLKTKFIILELTFENLYEEYDPSEVISYLYSLSFEVFDIVQRKYEQNTNRIICSDFIFRNKNLSL